MTRKESRGKATGKLVLKWVLGGFSGGKTANFKLDKMVK